LATLNHDGMSFGGGVKLLKAVSTTKTSAQKLRATHEKDFFKRGTGLGKMGRWDA
jgi:hypothetical protein